MQNNKSPKVWMFSTYPPGYGGISIHTKDLIELLESNGRKVELVRLNQNAFSLLKNIVLCLTKIKKGDIVHFHTSLFSIMLIFLIFIVNTRCFLLSTRVIVSIHEGDIANRANAYSRFRKTLISFALRNIGCCIFVSEGQRSDFQFFFPTMVPSTIISPLIETDYLIHKGNIISSQELKFISVAQYQNLYGLIEILAAISAISSPSCICSLTIVVGIDNIDKDYRDKVYNLSKKIGNDEFRIQILENIPREMVYRKYRENNIFIRHTKADSFGLSVSEALAHGLVCFASDVCLRPAGVIVYDYTMLEKTLRVFIDTLEDGKEYSATKPTLLTSTYEQYDCIYFKNS